MLRNFFGQIAGISRADAVWQRPRREVSQKHADSHTLNPLELLGKAIEQVGKIFGIENKAAEEGQPAESAQPESGPQAAQEIGQAKQEDDAESIDVLRAKLDEAVREERYEDAAKLRDRINSLSK